MQGSVESRGIRPAPVYYGSKIYENTTDEAEISFEEERFRQRIQEKASWPFSAAYQAPVACINETNMTNLVNTVDKHKWIDNVHQTPSRPGMNSLPCKFQERTQSSYSDDLTVDKESVISIDIMSMFSPQASRRNASFGQHWGSCSEAHLHHGRAATLHTRDVVNFREDGNISRTYAVNDVAPEDAKGIQCISISDEEVIDTRKSKKRRVYPTPISSDEGPGVKNCAGLSGGITLQREIMEPRLPKTEYRKPGGKVYPWNRALIEDFLTNLDPPLSDYEG